MLCLLRVEDDGKAWVWHQKWSVLKSLLDSVKIGNHTETIFEILTVVSMAVSVMSE